MCRQIIAYQYDSRIEPKKNLPIELVLSAQGSRSDRKEAASGQAIQACDKQCITGLQFAEHLFELRSTTIKTRQFFLEDRVTVLALEVIDLAFQVLPGGGNAHSRSAWIYAFTSVLGSQYRTELRIS